MAFLALFVLVADGRKDGGKQADLCALDSHMVCLERVDSPYI